MLPAVNAYNMDSVEKADVSIDVIAISTIHFLDKRPKKINNI